MQRTMGAARGARVDVFAGEPLRSGRHAHSAPRQAPEARAAELPAGLAEDGRGSTRCLSLSSWATRSYHVLYSPKNVRQRRCRASRSSDVTSLRRLAVGSDWQPGPPSLSRGALGARFNPSRASPANPSAEWALSLQKRAFRPLRAGRCTSVACSVHVFTAPHLATGPAARAVAVCSHAPTPHHAISAEFLLLRH